MAALSISSLFITRPRNLSFDLLDPRPFDEYLRLPHTYRDIYAHTCRRSRDIYTRKYSGPSAKHRSAEIKSVCYHGKFTAPNVNGRPEFDAVQYHYNVITNIENIIEGSIFMSIAILNPTILIDHLF